MLQETVCLQCGDIGFPETLIFCNGCRDCSLHRYCLDGPVIKIDDVVWFCEDCETKLLVPFFPDKSTPLSSESSDTVSLANDAIQTRGELKNCTKRVKKSIQQQQISKKEKQAKKKVECGSVTETKHLLSDCLSPPQLEHTQYSNSCEEESMLKNEGEPVPKDAVNSNGGSKSVQTSQEGNNECEPVPRDTANSNGGSKSVQTSQEANNDDLSCVELDGNVVAQPIRDPIWRGTLNLHNGTIGPVGLMAHVSTLACPKVHEESTLFPEVLHADLVPRSMVWPNHFKNAGLTDASIALYFFPESERVEIVFDKLVNDLIQHELAIKIVAANAELLIFPSTALPIQYWRFQAKYYLWGVFRRKQT